jgi:arsenate reductase
MDTILFACAQNAGRSQMAAALFNAIADPQKAVAISAGTRPAPSVHPEVVEVMQELGIDLRGRVPRLLTPDLARDADLLVTMGCGEACPQIPGLAHEDWSVPDPQGLPLDGVRGIQEGLLARISRLVDARGWRR